ncbi:MAG: tripartite tricarboxylate transporter substrate-binding protein [Variovorax sp.]
MTTSIRRIFGTICVAAGLLAASAAQAWPDKPVRIVVGYAAGGAADTGARIVAEQLQKKYGQAVTIDNKSGAGGRLATDTVAKAEPDGSTLLLMVGGDAVVAASDPKLPYNLLRDFQFAGTLSVYPLLLAAGVDSRTPTMKSLLEVAQKEPRSVRYATPGRGTTQHLAGELIAAQAGLEVVDVPYRGTVAAMMDVVTSRVDFTVAALGSVRGEIQSGKIKAFAVTSKERMAALPQVPTVAEFIPGFEVVTWMGIAAPARTPQAIVDQLSRDLREVMALPAVRERFLTLGFDPQSSTPAELRTRVEADVARWKTLLSTRKIDLNQ